LRNQKQLPRTRTHPAAVGSFFGQAHSGSIIGLPAPPLLVELFSFMTTTERPAAVRLPWATASERAA
jgi:hypothetical protein